MNIVFISVSTEDTDVLRHICKYLFKEWKDNYVNIFDIHSVDGLVNFFIEHKDVYKTTMILNNDGHFIGCYTKSFKGNVVWLSDVYIVNKYRKQGIGHALLEHAVKDHEYVVLNSTDQTLGFYEKFGFVKGLEYVWKSNKNEYTFRYHRMLYTNENVLHAKKATFSLTLLIIVCILGISLISIVLFW